MTGMTVLCDLDSRLYWVPTKFLYGMAGVWAVVVAVTTIWSVEAGIAWAAAGIGGALFAGIIFQCSLQVHFHPSHSR